MTGATFYFCGRICTCITQILVLTFENLVLKRQRVFQLQKKTLAIQVVMANIFLLLHSFFLLAFGVLETSSFIDCVYFTYTSILTIGFGDFVYNIQQAFRNDDSSVVLLCLFIHIVLFAIEYSIIMSIVIIVTTANKNIDDAIFNKDEGSIIITDSIQGDEILLMETVEVMQIGQTNEITDDDEHTNKVIVDNSLILSVRRESKGTVKEDQNQRKKLPDILQHKVGQDKISKKETTPNSKSRHKPRLSRIYRCDAKIAAIQMLRRKIHRTVVSTN